MTTTRLIAALALAAPATLASAVTVDFESFQHGEIVYAEVDGRTLYRAAFSDFDLSVENFHSLRQNGRNIDVDLGVVFDTNERRTQDPDLESPFDRGNIRTADLGNVLIIQEVDGRLMNELDDDSPLVIAQPDDEGRRPAGEITLDFHTAIDSFGFDLIDVEGPEEFKPAQQRLFRHLLRQRGDGERELRRVCPPRQRLLPGGGVRQQLREPDRPDHRGDARARELRPRGDRAGRVRGDRQHHLLAGDDPDAGRRGRGAGAARGDGPPPPAEPSVIGSNIFRGR